MGVTKTGDWAKAKSIVESMQAKFEKASKQAMMQEAHFLRREIVTGISKGAPGGKAFAPLSPITLAVRKFQGFGGTKILIRNADMRNSINVKQVESAGAVFVGILRSAKSKSGKSLVNVAETHEFGKTIHTKLTPKAKRFLAMVFSKITGVKGSLGLTKPGGSGVITIRIPARPFFGPVFEKYGKPDDVSKRFMQRLVKMMGPDLGTP